MDLRGIVAVFHQQTGNIVGAGLPPAWAENNERVYSRLRDAGYDLLLLSTAGDSRVEVIELQSKLRMLEDLKLEIIAQNPTLAAMPDDDSDPICQWVR